MENSEQEELFDLEADAISTGMEEKRYHVVTIASVSEVTRLWKRGTFSVIDSDEFERLHSEMGVCIESVTESFIDIDEAFKLHSLLLGFAHIREVFKQGNRVLNRINDPLRDLE